MPTASNRPPRHDQRLIGDRIGENNANNEYVSSAVVANADGSLLERAEYMQTADAALAALLAGSGGTTSLMIPRLASKAIAAAGTSFTTGLSPVTLFTVSGDVLCAVFAVATTALASTSNNGTLAIGVSGATGGLIAATTMDGTNFAINTVWAGDTSPTLLGEVLSGAALNYFLIGNGADIIATIATNSATAGAITFYCRYIPLSAGATVVAA